MIGSQVTHNPESATDKVLILSDGKPGHVNQAIAFARLLGLPFEVRRVSFRKRYYKALSYLFDWLGLSVPSLFLIEGGIPQCTLLVSAGSETYYANRVLARSLNLRSVAIMLPRNYRYGFDLIVAQQHDRPPVRDNILTLPTNLCYSEPKGLVTRNSNPPCVSIIIGGSSRHYHMDVDVIKEQLQQISTLFPSADFLVTTSRRTPPEVEELVVNGPFRYKVIASREAINPIPDFLAISDYVFVTEDSTSMISEAVCYGQAYVEILTNGSLSSKSKLTRCVNLLERLGCVHKFDSNLGSCRNKIDLKEALAPYKKGFL